MWNYYFCLTFVYRSLSNTQAIPSNFSLASVTITHILSSLQSSLHCNLEILWCGLLAEGWEGDLLGTAGMLIQTTARPSRPPVGWTLLSDWHRGPAGSCRDLAHRAVTKTNWNYTLNICTPNVEHRQSLHTLAGLSGLQPKMGFKWMFTEFILCTRTEWESVMEVPNRGLTCKFAVTWQKFV